MVATVDQDLGAEAERRLSRDADEFRAFYGAALDSDGRAITALASVPGDQRVALVLRHVDGLSVPEVAAALGRSVEAAESLLARGRVRFRQAYTEVSP